MIPFRFNEEKATEAAIFLLQMPGVDQKNYTKLLKMMYLVDRDALQNWGYSLTGDTPVSMPLGPVLSEIYHLINYHPSGRYWSKYISAKKGFEIDILQEIEFQELSIAEMDLLEKIHEKYKNHRYQQLIDICHDLPEWEDPLKVNKRQLPMNNEDILKYASVPIETISEIIESVKNHNQLMKVLGE